MKIFGLGIIAFLIFMAQRICYKKIWDKNLYVSVKFSQTGIRKGEKGEIVEVIENRKRLPLTMVKVKFQTSRNLEFKDMTGSKTSDQYYRNDVFQIGGGERITRKLSFVGKKRGYYHIKNIDMVGSDLFLSTEMVKSMSTDCYLYVYPRIFDSEELRVALQKLNGEVLVRRHLMEDPFEYRGIREYQSFDDMRSVNWKATAKTGGLMVNQKNYTAMQTIRIFLNTEDLGVLKKEAEMESSMQIVMGLSCFFLSQGIKVAFYTNGRDVITGEAIKIHGGAGIGQQDVIGRALARLDADRQPCSFVELFEEIILNHSEDSFTLFVSPNGYDDFLQMLYKLEEQGTMYTWFYPYDTCEIPSVPSAIQKHVQFLRMQR